MEEDGINFFGAILKTLSR